MGRDWLGIEKILSFLPIVVNLNILSYVPMQLSYYPRCFNEKKVFTTVIKLFTRMHHPINF